ncbi:MAG: hypothetical protein HPY81_04660 [Firmicutes bacterium]|nr:hypothetical protein [Bacillota bacterium]
MNAQRVVGKARLLFNLGLACFLVLGTVFWRYPGLARQAFYTVFREYVKTSLNLQTQDYQLAESEHFQVKYQFQDANVIPLVLETAEQIYQPINERLSFHPPGKIPIIVYPNMVALGKSFGCKADQRAMGVYWMGTIRLLSPNSWLGESEPDQMKRVFQQIGPMAHEYTHLVVDYITKGNYPRWLTEGIAQYEERQLTGFAFDPPSQLDPSQLYTLNQLDRTFDVMPDQTLAYWESLAAVDFIVSTYGKDKLMVILDQLGQGRSINTVMKQVLGCNLTGFESQFRVWLKHNLN